MLLRILSWNIYWGMGAPTAKTHQLYYNKLYRVKHSGKTLKQMQKFLSELPLDIVALQEADGEYHLSAFKKIFPFAKFSVERKGRGWSNGNLLLLKYDAVFIEKELPYFVEKRNYVRADLLLNGRMITVLTTHLGSQSTNEERMEQIKELCKLLKSIHHHVILIGDLNCEPTSLEFDYLLKNSELQFANNDPTYPVYKPVRNYDNVFVSKNIRIAKSGVLNVKLSDHLPVYVELVL
jgi:endonuclease/exonuclease/phosphatase family metal-dependent hydrolase